jgi:hypothetical protein
MYRSIKNFNVETPSIRKQMTILFFVYFGTHNAVFLFLFLPCCCFGFISKAATTKYRQYDFSLLCMSLAKYTKILYDDKLLGKIL